MREAKVGEVITPVMEDQGLYIVCVGFTDSQGLPVELTAQKVTVKPQGPGWDISEEATVEIFLGKHVRRYGVRIIEPGKPAFSTLLMSTSNLTILSFSS